MANVSTGELVNTIIPGDQIAFPFQVRQGDTKGRWLIHNNRNEIITVVATHSQDTKFSSHRMIDKLLEVVDAPVSFLLEIGFSRGNLITIPGLTRSGSKSGLNWRTSHTGTR